MAVELMGKRDTDIHKQNMNWKKVVNHIMNLLRDNGREREREGGRERREREREGADR